MPNVLVMPRDAGCQAQGHAWRSTTNLVARGCFCPTVRLYQATRNQEPGTRNQEPGTRNQEVRKSPELGANTMNDPDQEAADDAEEGPLELALVGDLTENESDVFDKILGVPIGSECVFYINSPGGSAYSAISLMNLIRLRGLQATGIVTGECSSAALWPFAACLRRCVTRYSVLLFHPMKWQSEEHVQLAEAKEWARHFGDLERDMDRLLAELFGVPYEKLLHWMRPGCYVSGPQLAEAGLAELVELNQAIELGEYDVPS